MTRKFYLILFFCCTFCFAYAHHLKGGWIYYQYLGPGSAAGTSKYAITVKQYLNCESTSGQIDQQIYLGIFYGADNSRYKTLTINKSSQVIEQLNINTLNPCITPKPDPNDVCYIIDSYTTTVDLPDASAGYTLAVQRCCRIDNIVNVRDDAENGVGLTYTTGIPGIVGGDTVRNNNSAIFAQNDVAVICINSAFTFDFHAIDPDNDSLVYSFCPGLDGGSIADPQPAQPSNPPYASINYNFGFSGLDPLGANATIDPKSGIISGIAPGTVGTYVVAVQALEYRNGILISKTRKEIHIVVSNCSLNAAQLKPDYITCDGFNFTFVNESSNNNISSYLWDFGVNGITTDTSTLPSPTYNYADTGAYVINLHVSNAQGCKDSAKSILYVYPGFIPNFGISGNCYLNAFYFTDSTKTKYGTVNNWQWNFGDNSTNADTSDIQNPNWTYPNPGTRTISLIVSNSKGCVDTVSKQLTVIDKPFIKEPFTDTLICEKDSVQLFSSTSGSATYSWQPAYNIINSNSANPVVYPADTTVYIVTVNQNGCINTDSILVNVISKVLVDAGADTTICKTDSIRLLLQTNALNFIWSPAASLSDSSIADPYAFPLQTTTYSVEASVGKCFATSSKTVKVVPYPVAEAFTDTSICFGKFVSLHGIIQGSSFNWSPTNTLLNANTLSPTAGPQTTTSYILTVTDTLGCPKPSTDTVTVTVIPKVIATVTADTMIVAGQPLQLNAGGGDTYTWTPASGLSDPSIANPIATLYGGNDTVTYFVKVTVPPACFDTASVRIIIFKTQPGIFIPTGFTPNGDGRNDILKPILVGMKQLDFFRVYNRLGNLLYATTQIGQGWDGTYKGLKQPSGTYVFVAEAVDYLGKAVMQKGTVVLIR